MNPTTDDKIRCKLNRTLTQMKLQNMFNYRAQKKISSKDRISSRTDSSKEK